MDRGHRWVRALLESEGFEITLMDERRGKGDHIKIEATYHGRKIRFFPPVKERSRTSSQLNMRSALRRAKKEIDGQATRGFGCTGERQQTAHTFGVQVLGDEAPSGSSGGQHRKNG